MHGVHKELLREHGRIYPESNIRLLPSWNPNAMSKSHSMTMPSFYKRANYAASLTDFLVQNDNEILGLLTKQSDFATEKTQSGAWLAQISLLRTALAPYADDGFVYFEFSIPRMGRRIDALAVIRHVVFVLEFKVGEQSYPSHALDQVWDYALDLKHFHETSHAVLVAPIAISTLAPSPGKQDITIAQDKLLAPLRANAQTLSPTIKLVLDSCPGDKIDHVTWSQGRYAPTPTIIEAATSLFNGHSVAEISRSEADRSSLLATSETISRAIQDARSNNHKAICFVTGVPGAGKTLVGLNVVNSHTDAESKLHSVLLSGNGPLVEILREALARDHAERARRSGKSISLQDARHFVKPLIQPIHVFRDTHLLHDAGPPIDHIAIFDEAQRAWDKAQTASFMSRKKGHDNFSMSEPEFLISTMDRHQDWAVIVCLVGGGQEINTGEAGIGEWIEALRRSFPHWHIHLSPHLSDSEYAANGALGLLKQHQHVHFHETLHLSISMRSFRAETVSSFVKAVLDNDLNRASQLARALEDRYPIMLTRDLDLAKRWLRDQARGTERTGVIVSSQAKRLKPLAIDVRSDIDPVQWFLHPKTDVRSSFYHEDVATEFSVQGLELDWTCVVWDADLRRTDDQWAHWDFKGTRWQQIRSAKGQTYLKNAYRVLLTRARQGMVIVVPRGDPADPTRTPELYDPIFACLQSIGLRVIS